MRESKDKRYKRIKRLIGRAEGYWRPRHEAMRKKIRMLIDGMHFADSEYESLNNRSDYVSWVGQESFHVWRHEVAFVCDSPSQVAVRPVDQRGEDPDLQEQAVSLVHAEWELPGKEYEELFEDMVGSASAAGFGAFMLEIQGEGRWGEIVPRGIRYDELMWDPAVKSPLSRRCRWVIIRVRMTRGEAMQKCSGSRARWSASVVRKLKTDEGYDPRYFDTTETHPVAKVQEGHTDVEWSEEDELTFYLVYERVVGDARSEEPEDGFEELPEDMRFMACKCGWRSDRQASLADGQVYPEDMVCPECGQVATRIDGTQRVDKILEYPDGRLSVIAPYGQNDGFVYEGDWEVPTPNYPIVFLSRFRHPTRPYGPSLADLNWNQIALDMVMRTALERMMVSASYWMLPADTLEDAWGQPWQFSDENGFSMYYRGTAAPSVQLLEGTGIPNSWGAIYSQARNALVDKTGIADFGMGPDQSRNIPASSAALQVQQQEIPTNHYKHIAQKSKGWAYELTYRYMQAVFPDERTARVKDTNGIDRVQNVRPSALPEYQFYCADAPNFRSIQQEEANAFNMVRELIKSDPWALDGAEVVYKLPHSLVQKMKESYARYLEGMQGGTPAGMPPVTGPAGAGAPKPPGLPGAPTPSANGMEPASAMVERLLGSMGPQQ